MSIPNDIIPIVGQEQVLSFAVSRVNMPVDQVQEYRNRVGALRDRLEAKIKADPSYALVRALFCGSLAKGTALRTTSDFDMAVYLKPDRVPTDERELSPWLIDRLKEARPSLADDQFQRQEHCVRILYRDGRKVDVVPVIDAGDGSGDGHVIHKNSGARVLTNVRRQLEFIRLRKSRCPVHYRQVIRLVKWWVQEQKIANADFKFKSYLAELICARQLDAGTDLTGYPEALAGFFSYIVESGLRRPVIFEDYYRRSAVPASAHGVMTVIDPVNPSNNVVRQYTEADRQTVVAAAQGALDALDEAAYAAGKGQAVSAWRDVLGTGFQG
jgi:tRNA nucleotidyltransferase (CCA-adding enzyme)